MAGMHGACTYMASSTVASPGGLPHARSSPKLIMHTPTIPWQSTGGSASFEGWGASASASFKSLSSLQLSTKDLTAMASMVYLSDPVTVINPAVSTLEVKLDPSAEELLRSQGPVAFHEEFGSHFISGYTKGTCVHVSRCVLMRVEAEGVVG